MSIEVYTPLTNVSKEYMIYLVLLKSRSFKVSEEDKGCEGTRKTDNAQY